MLLCGMIPTQCRLGRGPPADVLHNSSSLAETNKLMPAKLLN